MPEGQLFAARTFPEVYEKALVAPLFRPFAEQLVARIAPQRGESLIDIACGTGIVARVARERLGPDARIVGVDVAPAMLAVARSTESFMVLTCHQGLQFMPDKPAAIREMRRVLAPGGRVGISTWRALQDVPGVVELNAVAERYVGRIVDSRHSFGDPDALGALLVDSGFSDVRVETVTHDAQFADGALFVRLNAMAVIGMSDKGKALSEAERAELAGRIAAESQDLVAKATSNGMFVLPLSTNIATAHIHL
jgi:SAM-dependent methyltransferase